MASGAASLGFAGVRVRTSSKVCTMCTPSCLPAPPAHFTQQQSSCRAGGDHQARWAGAWGGEGSVPGVLERRGEDVDLRWWRGWRCLGERERRWRGLGVEGGYGRRGEREGEVDMGRRWRGRWRPGEREWWWRGLGVVDGYMRRGERGAQRGVWGEGEVDVGRRWRAWLRQGERERWWRGLGVGVLYGRWGEGEVDMGRRWRSWWCPGERERQERGLGGSWWHLGERERREWVVEARWECGRRGRVCRAGGEREHRRLRDWASSLESGQSGGVGGPWGASRGAAWYWGGGEVPCRPWFRHVGVWWRQRLVVWVEWLSLAGLGPGGPFGVDVVAGGIRIRFLVRGGWLVRGGVAPGGRWGMRVEHSVAAIPSAGAVRARGVVARWGRAVGSGSGGGGVGSGGGGAAGGGGVGSGGVGVAGMAHGPLVCFPVPLVEVGGRASWAVPGAALCGGQGRRVGGRA